MRSYAKPQVLTATKATAAIQGTKPNTNTTDSSTRTTNPGYEDNE